MTWDHDRVQELLAAHALRGLDPEDAQLAERALVEHVPGCPRCRSALEAFTEVAGDLGLLATPVEPPTALAARVRRVSGHRLPRRPRATAWTAAAVATLAALGLTAWNMSLVGRLDRAETQQAWLAGAMSTASRPGASILSLTGRSPARVTLMHDPAAQETYMFATRLPRTEGVYRVWFVGAGQRWTPGVLEPDERGIAMMPVDTDMSRWQVVMVTREGEGRTPSPTASPMVSASVDG
ncbi:MAG: anti-sigma factor domain-containing protein [Actinomycetota bacterium]